jgi:phospholipid/cholesterol/gamma-HCH transport system ATP-binding protein
MTMTQPKIRIRELRKTFGTQTVLAGVDLDIPAGNNLVLFGGSGSGKTVLAKCLLGLIEPDAGSIQVDGQETTQLSPREREALLRKIGVLFQNGALFDSLPVWQNISFALINVRQMQKTAARDIAVKALAAVGLTADTADLMPAELSGGMQKRVALARAIVGSPEILILDSPTDGLDPIVTTHIDGLIVGALKRLNAAALTITHDIDSARRIGDRAAFLFHGRITWEGPMAGLDRADDPELQRFLGRAADAAGRDHSAAMSGVP